MTEVAQTSGWIPLKKAVLLDKKCDSWSKPSYFLRVSPVLEFQIWNATAMHEEVSRAVAEALNVHQEVPLGAKVQRGDAAAASEVKCEVKFVDSVSVWWQRRSL